MKLICGVRAKHMDLICQRVKDHEGPHAQTLSSGDDAYWYDGGEEE